MDAILDITLPPRIGLRPVAAAYDRRIFPCAPAALLPRQIIHGCEQRQIRRKQRRKCHQDQTSSRHGKKTYPRWNSVRLAKPNPDTISRRQSRQRYEHGPEADAKEGEGWQHRVCAPDSRGQRQDDPSKPAAEAKDRQNDPVDELFHGMQICYSCFSNLLKLVPRRMGLPHFPDGRVESLRFGQARFHGLLNTL